ncbi:hypothetical protein SS1G_06219 [Sclerotinia sclerotiorum 1980 UF-70]|uniref:Uncharacterized protein n=1 Tax=Sclerotinia sclerotiorum (strain ATCC 18683 / 1980 / Ss-1) TaxID=665079 RepID=A7ELM2_SCLS1|nr:hypothetical protein SS1G_06219 [Sclerotinia sclerotiorum 1980 UF-70]EDO03738.1 hypothetical protein SS1G_06219 [Sclerotinia sclerotiorum 1980 UF-70]
MSKEKSRVLFISLEQIVQIPYSFPFGLDLRLPAFMAHAGE